MIVLAMLLLVAASSAFAREVKCAEHPGASCGDTGQVKIFPSGAMGHLYHCTCGDDYWIFGD